MLKVGSSVTVITYDGTPVQTTIVHIMKSFELSSLHKLCDVYYTKSGHFSTETWLHGDRYQTLGEVTVTSEDFIKFIQLQYANIKCDDSLTVKKKELKRLDVQIEARKDVIRRKLDELRDKKEELKKVNIELYDKQKKIEHAERLARLINDMNTCLATFND